MNCISSRACLAALCLILAGPAHATEIHYAPGENLERFDVALLERATKTIDMAAYVLTDVAVLKALDDAAQRGVRVRIFRDATERPAAGTVARAQSRLFARSNVEMRFNARRPFMHLKAYLVDGRILREGAANFSASGLKQQDNSLIILDEAPAARAFAAQFEAMWTR